ncbi:MAG: imidazole glycerol phosphate synthase subunit HisF [Sphingomicrobium sp.]
MLKVRVIPTLLWKNPGLVKGVRFDSWRRVGTILPAVKVYNARDVDELIVVDISANQEDRSADAHWVSGFSPFCFVPLTVGGGIRDANQIAALLRAGADKVSIGTAAYEDPRRIEAAARRFGSQCVVVSIDATRSGGEPLCVVRSGKEPTSRKPVEWAREAVERGAGEILLTSVDRDGTMEGYDLDLISDVCGAVDVPVIASGGAGDYRHMVEAVQAGASAVAAASMFHFTEQTPAEAKKALAAAGIPVRRNVPVEV